MKIPKTGSGTLNTKGAGGGKLHSELAKVSFIISAL